MSVIPCPNKIDCEGSDFPITNYSSEGPEQEPLFCSIVFPTGWDRGGCLSYCCMEESQNAADLCALAQVAHCPPPPPPCLVEPCPPPPPNLFCNVATTCTCVFNGSEFFYTTPAGTFCAATQEEADALAYHYACEHCGAPTTSVRLLALDACTCQGTAYSSFISYSGTAPRVWALISGSLPAGLSLNGNTGKVSGTPTTNGTSTFTVRAYLADGNYGQKTFQISVIEITTATIDPYTLGVPYSFQMVAGGGSGDYSWAIVTGTLPTGLSLSTTGLISGTPTAAGSATIQFSVVDTTCETAQQPEFVPRVTTTTVGHTIVRTRRGYGEFIAGGTGDLYKKVTYTGFALQTAKTRPSPAFGVGEDYCAGAQYIYSGSSEINIFGQFISSHRKDLFLGCTTSPQFQCFDAFGNANVNVQNLLGYCWVPDPQSCPACSQTPGDWGFKQNFATHSSQDFPHNIVNAHTGSTTLTPTSYTLVRDSGTTPAWNPFSIGFFGVVGALNPINFPFSELDSVRAYWINLFVNINYGATLSEPFTAQDEIDSQNAFTSNSKVSENHPSYLTWTSDYIVNIQSRYTSVDFTLHCSDLVPGSNYTVRYELWDSNGTKTVVTESFEAVFTVHDIIGSLPTPLAGHTIALKNVTIGYT